MPGKLGCMSEASCRASSRDGEAGSVVAGVPAYNESRCLDSVVAAASRHADEVVVVDDGSTDRTGAVAREAGATVLSHEHNRGKGCAVVTILEYVDPVAVDAVVLLDGDGQHRPAEIPTVVEPVLAGDSDLVIGSRYTGSSDAETPLHRRCGQTVLDTLTNSLSGADVTDSQSGFRALSPDAVTELDITTNGMGVESEMLLSAVAADLAVTEVPVDVQYGDDGGHSRHPVAHGLSVVTLLARSVGDRYPLLALGLPGVTAALAGVTALDAGTADRWRLALSAMLLAGVALLACGLFWRRQTGLGRPG